MKAIDVMAQFVADLSKQVATLTADVVRLRAEVEEAAAVNTALRDELACRLGEPSDESGQAFSDG